MIRVGLTGNIGSGKSTVAEIFAKLGVPVYHADLSAKEFLLNNDVKIILRKEFGDVIFDDNNEINRQILADVVFNNTDKLSKLNKIIHPFVIEDYENWTNRFKNEELRIENNKHRTPNYTIIEAAILFETGYNKIVDKIITVTCHESLRINRIMNRDGITEAQIRQRMNNQWEEEVKINKSDFVIINNQKQLLIPQVKVIHDKLLKS